MLDEFLSALGGQTTSDVAWTADLNYWIHAEQQAGRADPQWGTEEGYLELARSLGVMPYYHYFDFWLAEPQFGTGHRADLAQRGRTDDHTLPDTYRRVDPRDSIPTDEL